jgi:hypothetical protein
MSTLFATCIQGKLESGDISTKVAKILQHGYEENVQKFIEFGHNELDAHRLANDALDEMLWVREAKERQMMQDAKSLMSLAKTMQRAMDAEISIAEKKAAKAGKILEDVHKEKLRAKAVDSVLRKSIEIADIRGAARYSEVYMPEYHRIMAEFYGSNWFNDMKKNPYPVLEAQKLRADKFKIDPDNPPSSKVLTLARKLEAFDNKLGRDFSQAGAMMRTYEHRVPISHDRAKIAAMGETEYVNFLKERVQPPLNHLTKMPMTDGEVTEWAKLIYKAIVTQGTDERLDDLEPLLGQELGGDKAGWDEIIGLVRQNRAGNTSVAGSRSRKLHWKDGKSWMEYQQLARVETERWTPFGLFELEDAAKLATDLVANDIHHMRNRARTIGTMDVFGPTARGNFEFLKQFGTGDPNTKTSMEHTMFNTLTASTDSKDVTKMAMFFGSAQDVIRAGLLQASIAPTMAGDITTNMNGARLKGLSAIKQLEWHLRSWIPGKGNIVHEEAFSHMKVLADINNFTMASARLSEDAGLTSSLITRQINSWAYASGGARYASDRGRIGVAVAMQDQLESLIRHQVSMEELSAHNPELFKGLLDSGFDEDLFAALKTIEPERVRGAQMYTNRAIAEAPLDNNVKTELLISIGRFRETLQRMALNEPDVFSRSILTGGFSKGSTAHAAWTTATMFKTFLVGHWVHHLKPLFDADISRQKRLGMASRLMVSSLVTGAMMTTILSYMVKGEEPVPEDADAADWSKFLLKSLAYGGGLGFPLDMVMATNNPFGGVQGFLLGPGAGAMQNVGQFGWNSLGNIGDVLMGEQTFFEALGDIGGDALGLVKVYHGIPGTKTMATKRFNDAIFNHFEEGMRSLY